MKFSIKKYIMVINNIGEVCGREFKYFIEILKLKRNR